MTLTKTTLDDQIEVVGDYRAVQIRTATIIKEDGNELSRSFHRRQLQPGFIGSDDKYAVTDISSESTEIQGICNASWTDSVKAAHKTYLESLSAN